VVAVSANPTGQDEDGQHAFNARQCGRAAEAAVESLTQQRERRQPVQASLTGFGFLFGYIVLVATASFLEKFSMKQLNPYQVNFLMAIGMAVTAVPALWIKQGSLTVPTKALPLGAPIGLLMALGSISFVLALSELPVGMATGISVSYVLLVMLLSWIFLSESMNWIKIAGALFTITGVALLSWQENFKGKPQ